MVGLIWFVQTVHYPLFRRVGSAQFRDYHNDHTSRIPWVVGPAMLVEGITATALVFHRPPVLTQTSVWLGMFLLVMIWVSTAVVQVPLHNLLARGFDLRAYRRLVVTNWLRTIAWSLRGLLIMAMVGKQIR